MNENQYGEPVRELAASKASRDPNSLDSAVMAAAADNLLESIQVILRVLLVSEHRFVTAGGVVRYNPIDFQTLRYVERNPGCKAVDIAKHNEVAATTQQSVIDRLAAKGWIAKGTRGGTAGAKALFLTDTGIKLRNAIQQQDLNNMKLMLSILTDKEKEILLPAIRRIAERLDQNAFAPLSDPQ